MRDERGCVDVGNSVRDRCSGKAERAGRVRARIVSPCPGPQRSLALAAAAARRNSSESTPEKSALPRIAGDGMQTARARFSSRLSGRTCGSGAAAAPRKPASIDAPLERASSVARLRFHPIAISRMKAAQRSARMGTTTQAPKCAPKLTGPRRRNGAYTPVLPRTIGPYSYRRTRTRDRLCYT